MISLAPEHRLIMHALALDPREWIPLEPTKQYPFALPDRMGIAPTVFEAALDVLIPLGLVERHQQRKAYRLTKQGREVLGIR